VEYIDIATLKEGVIKGSECQFGYRESIFKHELAQKVIITAVCYRLSKVAAPHLDYGTLRPEVEKSGDVTPQGIRRAVVAIRDRSSPTPRRLAMRAVSSRTPSCPESRWRPSRLNIPLCPPMRLQAGPRR
jgi:UDP-N-acetylmuramate dehydrogenase